MPYKFSNVHRPYGAPMGRPDCYGDGESPCKLHLERVRLVDGDYDEGGAYWGGGSGASPLYVAYGEDASEQIHIFVRASNREIAKTIVRSRRRNVRFFR
jgi:hypothetical protein